MNFRFRDRAEAGRLLADKLVHYAGRTDVVILGLPRGGVPVAFEVAQKLGQPLHAFIVRKLGVPGQDDLAMGAIASGGVCVLNRDLIGSMEIPEEAIDKVIARERQELQRREAAFQHEPLPPLQGRCVIIIDDGLATGATMRAAVIAVRAQHAARIVVAAPVAARETINEFAAEVAEVVFVLSPEHLEGVGQWYRDFSQTTDDEVRQLLSQSSEGISEGL